MKQTAVEFLIVQIHKHWNSEGLSFEKILEQANNDVEKKYLELKRAFGDYFIDKNGYFTKHMIHIDTRGFKKRYTK